MAAKKQESAPPPLATPQQLADYLQRPVKTLEMWRYRSLGPPYIRMGREIRYDWRDVHAWEDSNKVNPAQGAA